jgi:hypothetical protein
VAPSLTTLYRKRLDEIRSQLSADLRRQFEALDADNLDGSFEEFVAENEARIAAGKATAQTLAVTYLELLGERVGFEPLPEDEALADETEAGTIRDGLAAIVPMVKAAIGNGKPVDEAIAFGGSLVERFVDNEMTRTADAEIERQSRAADVITGWRGIVSADSCDPCQDNAGEHSLDEELYRHPSCDCEREPVFSAVAS